MNKKLLVAVCKTAQGETAVAEALREAAEKATPVLCTHTEVTDSWGDGDLYPTHYRCLTCNDLFPVIGDTDLWAPVELKKEKP